MGGRGVDGGEWGRGEKGGGREGNLLTLARILDADLLQLALVLLFQLYGAVE